MASDDLIKSVSKKLKYYFQVKRLEDSFDLSGPHVPVLDHPPRVCGPVVHYPSVYDRSLKHYFSHPEARVQLTQFKLTNGDSLEKVGRQASREEKLRKAVERHLRKYNFAPQPVPFQAFVQTKNGLRLRPELRGIRSPYRTPCRRSRGFRGAYPLLRMTPNSDVSRMEGDRIVGAATRLLAATQSVDLSSNNYDSTASGTKLQYLPNSNMAKAAEQRRQKRQKRPNTAGRTSERSSSSQQRTSQEKRGSQQRASQDSPMPPWLRDQIARLAEDDVSRGTAGQEQSTYVRAYSAPTPPKDERRASSGSSARRRSLRRRTVGDGSENIATQTERQAAEEDQSYRLVEDTDRVEYQVLVATGSHIGASTNADVYLTLFGSLGRCQETQLVDSKTHRLMFRKGQTDEFAILLPYVGSLKRIQIGHSSQEAGSDWFLESVTVVDPRTNQRPVFRCGRWLSVREADGLTKRVLYPAPGVEGTAPSPPPADTVEPPAGADSRSTSASASASNSASSFPNGARESQPSRSRTESESSTEATASRSTASVRSGDGAAASDSSYTTDSESEESETAEEEEEKEEPRRRPKTAFKRFAVNESEEDEDEEEEEERKTEAPAPPMAKDEEDEDEEEAEEALVSQLNPIEEEEADNRPPDLATKSSSGRSSSSPAGSSRASSVERGPVSVDEEDDEVARVRVQDESAEIDFDERKPESGKSIHQAVEDGDLSLVIDLITNNSRNVNSADERGFMPLHIACERGHIDVLKWLCANGASIDTETPTGYGPLHLATLEGHLECMMALNALGADLNSRTTDGQAALHIAAKNGHIDSVRWLVSGGADVDLEDLRGLKPISWATQYGHMEVVQYLRNVSHDSNEGNVSPEEELERIDATTPPPVRVVPKRLSRRLTDEAMLEEKKKNYQRQVDSMSSSSSSFLDFIRNEAVDKSANT